MPARLPGGIRAQRCLAAPPRRLVAHSRLPTEKRRRTATVWF